MCIFVVEWSLNIPSGKNGSETRFLITCVNKTCRDVYINLDVENGDVDLFVSEQHIAVPIDKYHNCENCICNSQTRENGGTEFCNNINAESHYLHVTAYGYTAYTQAQLQFYNILDVVEGGTLGYRNLF